MFCILISKEFFISIKELITINKKINVVFAKLEIEIKK